MQSIRVQEEVNSVIFVIASLRPGGAQRVLITLANSFAALGKNVRLICLTKGDELADAVGPSVQLVKLDSFRSMLAIVKLAKCFKSCCPDLIISTQRYVNVVTLLAAKLSRTKSFLVLREGSRSDNGEILEQPSTLSRIVTNKLARCLYPRANQIVAVSDRVARDIGRNVRVSRQNVSVIANPIDIEALKEKASELLDHPWLVDDAVPIILGVGRLAKSKDFSTLIRAFSLVRKDRPARLIILGEGTEREYLERLLSSLRLTDDVLLPGFTVNPFPFFAKASVFVLTSLREGLPNVLLEALTLGTPIVSADCDSGPAEILENGRFGALVPVGDVNEFYRAITAVLEASDIERAPYSYIESFSHSRITNLYLRTLSAAGGCK